MTSASMLTCPKCHGSMRAYERGGVTVDQCADCRGIFLDRGELERLIDAEQNWHSGKRSFEEPPHQPTQYGGRYDDRPQRRRKKSFLDELFD